jgi:hypothetical protein
MRHSFRLSTHVSLCILLGRQIFLASIIMVSSEPADLWDEMLREHLRRLQRRNTTRLPLQSLEYKSFQATLESLDETARRAKVPEYIFRLRPALKHLDIFTSAINSLAQTKSNPLGFIWGSIQAVLAVSLPKLHRPTEDACSEGLF